MRALNLEIAADEAFSRAAGAPLIPGNRVQLLKDATENYPAWLAAIRSAQKRIHFESYIIHDDDVGQLFADVLSAKAHEGVKVRLLYDWIGALGNSSYRFFRRLRRAGVEVRVFNPPRFGSPFGWLNRDHRKMLTVDGRIGFVTGLCVGKRWVGSDTGLDAWRDTGVAVEGPAVADIERAFAETWILAGGVPLLGDLPQTASMPVAGNVAVRVVATAPNVAPIYRIDQLVAALARRSLWLSDAYFIGTSSYVQALRSAARSGVDVRLLIPGVSDIPIMRALSRAALRPLLEAGVRVFEWNGLMMHAKTAVADGYWARVGSTNLNLVSWVGNWELDLVVEDEGFARSMEAAYLADLSNSTEIVLDGKPRPATVALRAERRRGRKSGSASQTAARIVRLSNAVGAAITNRRQLGPAERVLMYWGAGLLAVLAAIAAYWPRGIAFPIAFLCAWISASLVVRAVRLRH
jgi:cardiolipin synthase A/B